MLYKRTKKSDRLYPSAPPETIFGLEQRLENKVNDVNSFNNYINNIEMITNFKDKNSKSKKKYKNYKTLHTILESKDTIVIIGATSTSTRLLLFVRLFCQYH